MVGKAGGAGGGSSTTDVNVFMLADDIPEKTKIPPAALQSWYPQ